MSVATSFKLMIGDKYEEGFEKGTVGGDLVSEQEDPNRYYLIKAGTYIKDPVRKKHVQINVTLQLIVDPEGNVKAREA